MKYFPNAFSGSTFINCFIILKQFSHQKQKNGINSSEYLFFMTKKKEV